MAGKIRIGIIGNILFKKELLDSLASAADDSLEFIVRMYEHQDQASDLYHEVAGKCDAILFSGPVPYFIMLENHTPTIPIEYVKHDEYSLLKAFFELRAQGINLDRLSIDTLPDSIIMNVYREIGMHPKQLIGMPFSHEKVREDVVSFHVENYKAGRTEFALTCRSIVKERLSAYGIPCYHMFWTRRTVLNTLESLLNRTMQKRYQGSQIVIGILKARTPEFSGSLNSALRMDLDLKQFLLTCSEALGVNLLDLGNGLSLFYTTYGALHRLTSGLTQIPELLDAPDSDTILSCGIGTGFSATAAEEGARQALHRAEQHKDGVCYVMLNGEELIGPLGASKQKRVKADDPFIQKLSCQVGVTAPNLYMIMEYTKDNPGQTLSAGELAKMLGVTPRTANRILNQLQKAGMATLVGEQLTGARQGRPRAVYLLDLN